MKKAFWWIMGILLSPLLLFIILTILLYLPPVQNWAVKKVATIASEKTGMQITVDHVNLAFPLDLAIDGFRIIQPPYDTIAAVNRMVVDVQLMPLLEKRVVINELEVTKAQLNTNGFVDAAQVKGRFGRLFVASKGIDLDKETIEVNGATIEDGRFDVALRDSVPEDTTNSEAKWKINIDSVSIYRTHIDLHMPGDTLQIGAHIDHAVARKGVIDLGEQVYSVASFDWNGGQLSYDNHFEPAVAGLDFNHINLDNIHLGVDSIYYHDPFVHVNVRTLKLKEKSGLEISDLTGRVTLNNGRLRLPKFRLKTPDTDVEAELDMPLNLMEKLNPQKMRLRLNAQIGKQDLMRFMGGMPQRFQQQWPNSPLSIKGSINGNMEYCEFAGLDVSLPSAFHATATGFVAHVDNPKLLHGKVQFTAKTQNMNFITQLLPKDVQRNYRIPQAMAAQGVVTVDGQQYGGDVTLREGNGVVKAKGTFNSRAMSYQAKVSVRNLNVHHFMPHDSIYTVTADVTAHGKGTDFLSPRTTLHADAKISQLRYGHWNLTDVTAQADVKNGRTQAQLYSDNELLNGNIHLDALTNSKMLNATIRTDLIHADLYEMRLVKRPVTVGLCGLFDVKSDLKQYYQLDGFIDDLVVIDSGRVYRPTNVNVQLLTNRDTTWVKAQSGNMQLDVAASGGYEKLIQQSQNFADELSRQFSDKIINQQLLREKLPVAHIYFSSDRDNPFASLLKTRDVQFKDMMFDLSSSPVDGLNGKGYVHTLEASGTRIDTIDFKLSHYGSKLSFSAKVQNNKRNPQFVFKALFDGVLQERGATVGVRYYDAADKMGVRLGAQAELLDSGINIHLMPARPTIGYKEFNLNKDNFIFLGPNNKLQAKVNLVADDKTSVKIYSEDDNPEMLQDLTVSLHQFNLNEVTSVLPYVPRMTGLLNGDFHIVQDQHRKFSVVSGLSVDNMTYEHSPLGNVATEFIYLQKDNDAHAVEARLLRDDVEIGLLNGVYYNEGTGSLDAKLTLERLPMAMANGFIPDQIFGFEGYADGVVDIKGPLAKPIVNGELQLDSAYMVSVPYGMRLRFKNDVVRVVGSNLQLENFTIYAHNDNPLVVNGHIDFSDLAQMMVDLRMQAQNYQIVSEKENPNSIAYGKAFVNFFGRISGAMDNLQMRGKLDVLGTTDMSYVLRDSPLTTDNQLDELVKFTDFSDTTQTVVARPSLTGFNMDLTMEVSKGAHIMAYLNADHSNYVDLMGGGTLRLKYNPTDNLRLTGKYTLSNGEMKYSLPVIPLKTFTIQDGSYIEFTGDVMNPTLNITATERTKATVSTQGGVGRSVEFDCGVVITKTLSDMGLEFTLDAPEDMALHSELQSMSVEQRGKLAVSMLTTGMYLADGNTGSFSMNSALSSFLNSEINQITGNALRTLDLSFGMDNSTDASGNEHTDYSFKFAKRFWNNRLKVTVGGKVSTGAEIQNQNHSFFDNVLLEYRLDDTANKYVSLFYENNAYDWLEGYTQKYGGGFIWRRTLQHFSDIFKLKADKVRMPMRALRDTTQQRQTGDTLRLKQKTANEK